MSRCSVTGDGPAGEAPARRGAASYRAAGVDIDASYRAAGVDIDASYRAAGVDIDASYRAAGVDIDAGNRAVSLMAEAVASTLTPEVVAGVGGFGGMYSAAALPPDSVLVASTDGVGTKVVLAARHGRWRGSASIS